MPFVKGDSRINRKGRALGAMNENTRQVKDLLVELFTQNVEYINSNMDKLTLHQRLMLNKEIMPYILPKQEIEHISKSSNIEDIEVKIVKYPEWMDET